MGNVFFLYMTLLWASTGRVIKGMGVVGEIENAKTDKRDHPLTSIRIESVSVHAE